MFAKIRKKNRAMPEFLDGGFRQEVCLQFLKVRISQFFRFKPSPSSPPNLVIIIFERTDWVDLSDEASLETPR